MTRRLISSGSTFERDIGYSRAVVDGEWVFVSGTTGFDYSTMTIAPDLPAQTEQCLRNIASALEQAGATLADVVRVHYILPDANEFPQCWPVLRRAFAHSLPAATMIEAGLADPRMRIEIEVTAHRRHKDPDAATAVLLAELEQRLARAWLARDRAFIEELLADDWSVTDASGTRLTRREVIEEAFSSGTRRIDTMTIDDVEVRCFVGFAVVTGRTRASGAYQDQPASVVLRFTDIFELRGGRWQIIASHATQAP